MFVKTWDELEPDREELNTEALRRLAITIVDDNLSQDPVEFAQRTFGTDEFADWMPDLYPGYERRPLVPAPPIQADDVPF
jgi:hypothetical protein